MISKCNPSETEDLEVNNFLVDKEHLLQKTTTKAAIMKHVKIKQEMGQGATATVYLVDYRRLLACLKMGHKPMATVLAFMMEANTLLTLQGAGGAPTLIAVAVDAPMMVTSFRPGKTLESRLPSFVRQPLPKRLRTIYNIVWRLREVHEAGIIHHDIKADNILLSEMDGVVSIVDFGLGGEVGQIWLKYPTRKRERNRNKFRIYSPEFLNCRPSGPHMDVFSLGVMLADIINMFRPTPTYFQSWVYRYCCGGGLFGIREATSLPYTTTNNTTHTPPQQQHTTTNTTHTPPQQQHTTTTLTPPQQQHTTTTTTTTSTVTPWPRELKRFVKRMKSPDQHQRPSMDEILCQVDSMLTETLQKEEKKKLKKEEKKKLKMEKKIMKKGKKKKDRKMEEEEKEEVENGEE
ncbi:hypothetical protein Pmani_039498 [Petrolisthes manimaculis]|uniref:Protein kinase domain-containing protein n=1 Tax=Petrolisthes manimaculis TaxID=1843537 RepID=A0AAE1TJF6_9EUCA|nr:hypothetical protein Pmani_039498 [Petrolisthes manimaculis]